MRDSASLCKIHNLPISYFCLVKDCPSNTLCETCATKNHQVHGDSVFQIEKYFSKFPYNKDKADTSSLNQIQNTINSKSKLIEEMNKRLSEAENEILDRFDELKHELMFMLDNAYQQYAKQIREIHSNSINEIERGMKKLQNLRLALMLLVPH
jgi:vacuolar-type H+-ATPase subunit H